MSTPAVVLGEFPKSKAAKSVPQRLDWSMLAGIAIVVVAVVAGIMTTGVRLSYFFQPTGALIVLGGTLGVTFVTTPHRALIDSARRAIGLARATPVSRGSPHR